MSDPREDEKVTVISTCDVNQLSPDPKNPQATLYVYLQAVDELKAKATTASTELRDACNMLDTELGLPTGADVTAACKPIGARVAGLAAKIPPFGTPPPGTPSWGELRFAPNCTPKPQALGECIATCAGPCDATKCDPAKVVGKCNGACTGQCVTRGEGLPCNGKCVGDVPVVGPPTTCNGECRGFCLSGAWSGECGGACGTIFAGTCGGTCTGTCDGAPVNVLPDAGTDAGGDDAGGDDGGDASAEGGADAGGGADSGGPPPSSGLPPPPPDNAPGNCKGFCFGVCSSGSNGTCNGIPCFAFSANGPAPASYRGYCLGECGGLCKSATGTGATATCTGECTQTAGDAGAGTACSGICRGTCAGTLSETTCEGSLKCDQNLECENACQARSALATVCAEPTTIETYAVSDPVFAAALAKHGPMLAKAVSQIPALRTAYAFLGDRAYGDFVAIGLQGDLARACVAQGKTTVGEADVLIRALLAADPTVYRRSQ